MGGMEVDKAQFEAWLVEKNNDYLQSIRHMDASEILPDVPRILQFLKEHHLPIALGSASKNAVPILEKIGLRHYFSVIIDGNQVTRAKPDPEVFLLAAAGMGIKTPNCVVFEDAVAGIQAANLGGMTSVGIGDADVLEGAHYVFRDFTEISTHFIEQLAAN
jgi:beta-phosphoglucomutase